MPRVFSSILSLNPILRVQLNTTKATGPGITGPVFCVYLGGVAGRPQAVSVFIINNVELYPIVSDNSVDKSNNSVICG